MPTDMSWLDFERAGWNSHVDAYHAFFGTISEQLTRPLLDAVGAGAGSRLLDACCGPGVARKAAERGSVVDGIDIAPAMVELAARLYPLARFRVGDAEELPYADNEFDAVVYNIGLHHLTSPARGIAEFARVLRGGGRLSLSVWDENRSALGIVPEAIAAAGALAPAELPTPPQQPAYDSAEELEPLLGAAGFRLEAVELVGYTLPFPSAESLWEGWLAAAIRSGPLLAAQSDAVQRSARTAYYRLIEPDRHDDGSVVVPVGFIVATSER